MKVPEPINLLRKRLSDIKDGSISFQQIIDFDSKDVVDRIVELTNHPKWWPQIAEFINSELPLAIENLKHDLSNTISKIKKTIFSTETVTVVSPEYLANPIDMGEMLEDITIKKAISTEKLSQKEYKEILNVITNELNNYQENLAGRELPGTESNNNANMEDKIIIERTVGQLGAFIRILIESGVISSKQWEKNKKRFAEKISNYFITSERKKKEELISYPKLSQVIQKPEIKDMDHWIVFLKEMQIKAANLKSTIGTSEDKPAKGRRK